MSNITPGPWRWIAQGAGPEDEWGCHTPGEINPLTFTSIGYCYNPELVGPNGTVILSAGAGEYNPFKTPVDAVAIAAVPEMLALLYDIRAAGRVNGDIAKRLIATIAKAEGRL